MEKEIHGPDLLFTKSTIIRLVELKKRLNDDERFYGWLNACLINGVEDFEIMLDLSEVASDANQSDA
jgi:hypothetical protein